MGALHRAQNGVLGPNQGVPPRPQFCQIFGNLAFSGPPHPHEIAPNGLILLHGHPLYIHGRAYKAHGTMERPTSEVPRVAKVGIR